jgi:hypothetical protein
MKRLAKQHTQSELEQMLGGKQHEARGASESHLKAIRATGSMQGNSSRRAHARNVVAAAGETMLAIKGAIEIHELFPEFAKAAA